ncbi:flagellar assembly protein FliW [Cohnella algarum]|uniref:flagellar assembly protein FliW n=1 Tax=Cohnella algarum TaxID=2044859 RepID=UPI00196796A2|nr:flagellar assembly protein FliW [Cohnella algarum]
MTHEQPYFALQSDVYGTLQVNEEQVFEFQKGIIGLQEIQRYALFQLESTPFSILHALDAQISFILIPASEAVEQYGFRIDDETAELLRVAHPEEVVTMLVVNVIEDRIYVNLKAPILLSPTNRSGVQFVIHDQELPVRYPLSSGSKEEITDAGA